MDKQTKKVVEALEEQGFEVRISKKQHIIVTLDGRLVTTMSGTASDHRAIRNAIAQARRAGFRWP
ncbi:hypothetical protein [Nocardioides stalactiti]|uniref:hypothetical protein n=1 Tax=Nocardioides stalactiti TaxID=2755356 RepID=UPI0015FF88EE|nr:hypothetical protein [Nocardioides stalactiti]